MMKSKFTNAIKGFVILTGIFMFAIWQRTSWLPIYYLFPLTGPELAIAHTQPIINIPRFKANGEEMEFKQKWILSSSKFPKMMLSGLNEFLLLGDNSNDNDVSASIEFEVQDDSSIKLNIKYLSISLDNTSYSTEKYLSVSSCKKNNEQLIEQLQGELPEIKADIQIKEFWQGFKKVVIKADIKNIKTTLYPHPYITCVNGVPVRSTEEPIEFEIPEMSIDIDSWFTYIWSNKGGTTYKL